ncbi:neuroepithelial cell-transforming gene 1 protein-like isoform X2 [Mizuhopecten yessoensis]|uniref:Neuroepithelial cell-transforming gene 1 protein n=1 Tax=Mizuhopecten yessoensis TaxID=6573 RepID=A0A210R3J6_MIZYE|nr:neuroepithelial cell-transforming gene 1 protein-like isoform X2 [Mizuhopecten yessoensis]OWF55587.1 Neuroepithelial cell-transforming gene 1 protein [Mizuhopecten yessoensis]
MARLNLTPIMLPEIKDEKSCRRHSVIGLANFELPSLRKRKRKLDEDSLSIQSFDVEHKKKSRRSLLRVSSLANLLSPSKGSNKTGSDGFQRSISFKVPSSPASSKQSLTPYKAPSPSPAKKRLSRTWSDMMTTSGNMPKELSHRDIKKQEAIYELYQGEKDLAEDLINVKKTYRDSMKKLQLLSEGELQQIFGPIDSLIPVHEDLAMKLQMNRCPDGTTDRVGEILVDWVPSLKEYVTFCSNQVFGKALLDEKRTNPAVDDFLQRCQNSPFSRKLDLWTLLDGARSKFIKYPLLIKSIRKYTQSEDEDTHYLNEAIKLSERVIAEADQMAGEAKCRYFRCRISFLYDDEKCEALEQSSMLVCNGILKNNKNSKLHIFLFDKVLVVTRTVNQGGHQCFQVYRQPIPIEELILTDLKDGEVKMGSFRKTFGSGQTTKNVFRLSFQDSNKGQSHTLTATDEHDKRQWLQSIQKTLNGVRREEGDAQDSTTSKTSKTSTTSTTSATTTTTTE